MTTAGARAGIARVDAPTILLVEDIAEAREQASKSLRKLGYAVEEAADGGQAVRRAARRPPDLVVMDLSLPIMDGIEAMRRIRAMARSKRPHVIVMSGRVDARTRQLAFEAGCDQYIVKPCEPEELAAAVRAYFTKRDGHA
jgi:DNA-binding response OmpR family regulator